MSGFFSDSFDRLQREMEDADRGIRDMERDLDRRIGEINDLRQELTEERLERVRLEGEVRALVEQVTHLQRLLWESQELPEPMCTSCGKHPDELPEYSSEMTGEDLSPTEYVRQEEGTYNTENGHFMCTECYIKVGMPSAVLGWTAP